MDNTTRYFNFVKKYNEVLTTKGIGWLGPDDLGKVLLDTARDNNAKSKVASSEDQLMAEKRRKENLL
jgi:hypothetical protein